MPEPEDPETIYTTNVEPDVSSASDVLAFLLIDPKLFVRGPGTPEQIAAMTETVRDALDQGKRKALLEWFERRRAARAN